MNRIVRSLVVSVASALLYCSCAGADDEISLPEKAVAKEAAAAAENPSALPKILTQRDFAVKLIQDLNLGSLPKKPKDISLLAVLDGRRTIVVEAEENYDKRRDRVSVRPYNAIGEFSGKGWLSGTVEPTAVSLKARIPLAGVYRMKVRASGDGHLWSVGGRAFKASFGPMLKDVEVGTVILDAELMSFNVILPPDGALDVITFTATDLPSVQPSAGWQFDAPLTYGAAAEVAAKILINDLSFADDPAMPPRLIPAAGNAALPSGASLVTDQIYGKYFGDSWLRNGFTPSKVEIPFQVATGAFYGFRVHWLGEQLIGTLDGISVEGKGKRYLDWVDLGVQYLAKGKHLLKLDLPPSAGIDSIELTTKISGESAFLKLLGWPQDSARVVPPSELERLIKDIAARYRYTKKQ